MQPLIRVLSPSIMAAVVVAADIAAFSAADECCGRCTAIESATCADKI